MKAEQVAKLLQKSGSVSSLAPVLNRVADEGVDFSSYDDPGHFTGSMLYHVLDRFECIVLQAGDNQTYEATQCGLIANLVKAIVRLSDDLKAWQRSQPVGVELSVFNEWKWKPDKSKLPGIFAAVEKGGIDLDGVGADDARALVADFMDVLLHTVDQSDTFIDDNKIAKSILMLGRKLEEAIALDSESKVS